MVLNDYNGHLWNVEKVSKDYKDVADWDISGSGNPENFPKDEQPEEGTLLCGCVDKDLDKAVWWISKNSRVLGE